MVQHLVCCWRLFRHLWLRGSYWCWRSWGLFFTAWDKNRCGFGLLRALLLRAGVGHRHSCVAWARLWTFCLDRLVIYCLEHCFLWNLLLFATFAFACPRSLSNLGRIRIILKLFLMYDRISSLIRLTLVFICWCLRQFSSGLGCKSSSQGFTFVIDWRYWRWTVVYSQSLIFNCVFHLFWAQRFVNRWCSLAQNHVLLVFEEKICPVFSFI